MKMNPGTSVDQQQLQQQQQQEQQQQQQQQQSVQVTTVEASSGGNKALPKDALAMISILKDVGIMEWEPRVLNQLLEFAYRYVTSILDDAKMFSAHAKKKAVDVDDVRLAVQMYTEQNVTTPPMRDVLLDMARAKNASSLPIPKPTCGLRLPPDRHCLTACNYRLRYGKKRQQPPTRHTPYSYAGAGMVNSIKGQTVNKIVVGGPPVVHAPPTYSVVNAAGGGGPRPMIKVNSSTGPKIQIQQQAQQANQQPMFTMTVNPMKRKAEDMHDVN